MNLISGLRNFFFPKNFMGEMLSAQHKAQDIIKLGQDRVARHRYGKFFFMLFNWLPFVGTLIFYIEGHREKKEVNRYERRKKKKRR